MTLYRIFVTFLGFLFGKSKINISEVGMEECVHLLLYCYFGSFSIDSVTFHNLIQATDVVIQRPKEIIPSDHQQLLSEVETIYRLKSSS